MAVIASDIAWYAAANKPEDDSSTNGGAIDADIRVLFTDLAADDDVEVFSSSSSDTSQTITVRARQEDGTIDQQAPTLDGTTPVVLSTLGVVERILSATLSADCVGTVTVRRSGDNTVIATIPPGERGFRRLFINATAEATGGSSKTYYEKVFCKNNNSTSALIGAAIVEASDSQSDTAFCLASAKDDSVTTTNRLTAPSGANLLDPDTFNGSSKSVPGGSLGAGEAIGVWLQKTLPAGTSAGKGTYGLTTSGTTV